MNPQKDHTALIVGCITAICCTSLACATLLIMKGYTAELMVGIASAGAGSLGTMLGQRRLQPSAGGTETNIAGDVNLPPTPPVPPTNQPNP